MSVSLVAAKVRAQLAEMEALVATISTDSDWSTKLPQVRHAIAALQHLVCASDNPNTPLLQLQSMQTEIADLKRTIETFPDPVVKDKALRIVDHLVTMSGSLFVGPSQEGQTPYLHAAYRPKDLTAMLRDVSPFLTATLEIATRPYAALNNTICQQNTKIDQVLEQVAFLQAEVAAAKERAQKAEWMNVVYDFTSSCERLLCKRFNIESSTISRALRTSAIDWTNLRSVLEISDAGKERLVNTIKKIKDERLEYGHTSKAVAEKLVLATSLIPIAQDHFTLTQPQIDILNKMLKWTLSEMDHTTTLLELRQAVE
ncbi:hypothetical protein HDU87_003235 [Geranomyces variabilis]|uniref:Uncharacterized protein n=1 Tax=Geranomyces variabilis TaxID=109894 RepID=A0AAD5XMS4_9FUNG|nr:hypothetical protein HDU87_003235 [Geranomyces variabilis]